ncbi:hypothetical protein [Kitasatospora camelliae]|uniref:Uncharacterized protein n=1 Tax=Kitasatospora camelliae TaxID=3156397 RepID=A0AAU8JRZ0_9ACTN
MERAARLEWQEARLDGLLGALGAEVELVEDPRVARFAEREPLYPLYHRVGHKRQAAYRALGGERVDRARVSEHYDLVLAALTADDDPSSPRWLAQSLVAAAGRRRVLESLLRTVELGTPYERGCAAGVWRWAEPPLRHAADGTPTRTSVAERASLAELRTRFEAACRSAAADCPDPWARDRLRRAAADLAG